MTDEPNIKEDDRLAGGGGWKTNEDTMLALVRKAMEDWSPLGGLWPKLCDWQGERMFTVHDEPGEHEPCYLNMPSGGSLAFAHHATNGVDQARATFIANACNQYGALVEEVERWRRTGIRIIDGDDKLERELAALRQRCEQAERRLNEASHDAIYEAHKREQAERERDESRSWRNRWIDSKTCDIQRDSGMSYEEARCEAEYAANEMDARFKAATERHAALAHDAQGAANE